MEKLIEKNIDKLFKIGTSIYNLYNILAKSKNENEYKSNKELLENAIRIENKIIDSIKNITELEMIVNYFDKKINCTMIDNYFNIELPYYFNESAKVYLRLFYKLDKKLFDKINDTYTYNEYLNEEITISAPEIGNIVISQKFIDNNDGITLENNNKKIYIDFKEVGLKNEEDFSIVKEGIVYNGQLYFYPDDAKASLYYDYIDKANSEIILNFLNISDINDKEYIYKLMYNNEYLENILLKFDLDINKTLEFFNQKRRNNDTFYNYIIKQQASGEYQIIDILCTSSNPKYDLYIPYLKTILSYKSDEELEEINYIINNNLEVTNKLGFNKVKEIFSSLSKYKRKL